MISFWKFITEQKCHATIASSDTTKWCVFPFIYNGKTYEKCTIDDSENSKPWCSYEVDDQGAAVPGKWADCNPGCPGLCKNYKICN